MLVKSKLFIPSWSLFSQGSRGSFFHQLAHDSFFEQLFEKEFSRLEEHRQTYLDHAGAALYGKSQLEKHFELLDLCALGHPDSVQFTAQNTTASLVETTRKAVISYFQAHDYHCIFTQNTTQALRLVGEHYPFDETSQLLLLAENHHTYTDFKDYCSRKGSSYAYSILRGDLTINAQQLHAQLTGAREALSKLFLLPARSEVSGVCHDLSWIRQAQDKGWDVLLDADAYASSAALDLSVISPDFMTVSFYKMFGYPAGIGCLLVKKKIWEKFGSAPADPRASLKIGDAPAEAGRAFESGTIDYLAVPAVKIGLDFIQEIGIERIRNRVASMNDYLSGSLRRLKHSTGLPIVRIYGPEDHACTGGTLLMNCFDAEGKQYPFQVVGNAAHEQSISICASCFCNPGIHEMIRRIASDEFNEYFLIQEAGTYNELVRQYNRMNGSIRVSVGIATRKRDLDRFIDFVHSFKDKRL